MPSVRAISDQTGFIEDLLTIRSLVAARTEGSRATLSVPRSSVVAAHSPHGAGDTLHSRSYLKDPRPPVGRCTPPVRMFERWLCDLARSDSWMAWGLTCWDASWN